MFTIGHSTRAFDELVRMLRKNGVTSLVDVRSYPSSRAFPQWNQDAIVKSLPDDIDYKWIQDLGGRRHTRAGTPSVNDGWRVKAFRDYADYMQTPSFQAGLQELIEVNETGSPAIMCSEAVPWRCHRRLITDALLVRDIPVFDTISEGVTRPATITPFAKVDGLEITYPKPEETAR